MSFKDDVIAGLKKVNRKTVVGIIVSVVALYFLWGVYSTVNAWWAGPGSDPAKNLAVKEALAEKRQKVLAMELVNNENQEKLETERFNKEEKLKALQAESDELNHMVNKEKVRCDEILEKVRGCAKLELDGMRDELRAVQEEINNLRFNNLPWDEKRKKKNEINRQFLEAQSEWNSIIDQIEHDVRKRMRDLRNGKIPAQEVKGVFVRP